MKPKKPYEVRVEYRAVQKEVEKKLSEGTASVPSTSS
jgi:hypothetical protein